MIHGLRNNKAGAATKFLIAKRRLGQLGYKHPIIGYSYDSNTKGAHIRKHALRALRVGEKIAKKNGKNLSQFIIDLKNQSCIQLRDVCNRVVLVSFLQLKTL